MTTVIEEAVKETELKNIRGVLYLLSLFIKHKTCLLLKSTSQTMPSLQHLL